MASFTTVNNSTPNYANIQVSGKINSLSRTATKLTVNISLYLKLTEYSINNKLYLKIPNSSSSSGYSVYTASSTNGHGYGTTWNEQGNMTITLPLSSSTATTYSGTMYYDIENNWARFVSPSGHNLAMSFKITGIPTYTPETPQIMMEGITTKDADINDDNGEVSFTVEFTTGDCALTIAGCNVLNASLITYNDDEPVMSATFTESPSDITLTGLQNNIKYRLYSYITGTFENKSYAGEDEYYFVLNPKEPVVESVAIEVTDTTALFTPNVIYDTNRKHKRFRVTINGMNTISTGTSVDISNLNPNTTYDYTLVVTDTDDEGEYDEDMTTVFTGTITTERKPTSIYIKQDGEWVLGVPYVKNNGSWVEAVEIYVKDSGSWSTR